MSRRAFIRSTSTGLLLLGLRPNAAWSAPADQAVDTGADNERWQAIRKSVFGSRAIAADTQGLIALELPLRAADAAVVPVAIRTKAAAPGAIRKLYLVVDRNPSPVGATFTFGPTATATATTPPARADVETRIRVEEYSHVRAIAEMSDGQLVMQTRFIKASGGCSAPAGGDLAAMMAAMGRVNLRLDGAPVVGRPVRVQLTVNHPNVSGLAIDQVTRLAPLPHYVRTVDVSYGGQPVLSADVDFTLSENPTMHFWFVPKGDGELRADVVDSQDRKSHGTLAVRTAPKGDA